MDKQDSQNNHKMKLLEIKLAFLALPAVYLMYNFLHTLSCQNGALNCKLGDFAVIFPFYLPLAVFISRLSLPAYFLLYLFSAAIYLVIFYHFESWFEQIYQRIHNRPDFRLKRVRSFRVI